MSGFKDDKVTEVTEVAKEEAKEEKPKKPFRCHMLLTKILGSVPEKISTLARWGGLVVVIGNDPKNTVSGEHVFIEGSIDDIEAWLKGKKVWMGKGHPQFQQFEEISY